MPSLPKSESRRLLRPCARCRRGASRLAVILVCGGIWLLISVGLLIVAISASEQDAQRSQELLAAPFCAGNGPLANLSVNCRLRAPMTVVDKWDEDHGNKSHYYVYKMELRTDSGDTYDVDFDNGLPSVYQRAALGATVETERWNDQVMWVAFGGVTDDTADCPQQLPGRGVSGAHLFIGMAAFLTLLPLFVLIVGVRNALRDG